MRKIIGTIVTTAALLAGLPSTAQAAIAPVAPVRVVMSGPVVHVRMTMTSSTPTTARGGHGVEITSQLRNGMVATGEAWSDYSTIPVSIDMPSMLAPIGDWRMEAEDYGDGRVTPILVRVLRASRLSIGPLATGSGVAVGMVALTHYDPMAGRYVAAPGSPVRVERLSAGRWVLAATWTTDMRGVATGAVRLPAGPQTIRYVRPDGARDAAASSGPMSIKVT